MWDSIDNKCEPKLLFEKNANAFLGLCCSLGMSSSLQNPQLTKQMKVEMCLNRHYIVPPRIWTHNCTS